MQELTQDRVPASGGGSLAISTQRRRLRRKQHPLGEDDDMEQDPLTFCEKSGFRRNRVSTVSWPCPICKVVFTWTGHDKALSKKQRHMKLEHNTRLSEVGGSKSDKMKKQWQENPVQFKSGAGATKKAMLRAKQLQDKQRHDLAHATSLGLFACAKKTWFCRKCLPKGTTRQLTERACEPEEWCFKKSNWWLGLKTPHREALAKACGLTEKQVSEYSRKASEVVQKASVCTDHRSESVRLTAAKKRAKWRKDNGLTARAASVPGQLNAVAAVPSLRMKTSSRGGGIFKRPAAAKASAPPVRNTGPGTWERDLTQENIEPHPGPQKEARARRKQSRNLQTLLLWQLNIASFQLRGWDLLEAAERCKVDVVVMQETRMTNEEASRLNSNLKHWNLFHQQEVPQLRRASAEGGVAIAVRRGLPAVQAAVHHSESGQWLRVALPGLHVTSAYRSQRSHIELEPYNVALCQGLGCLGKTSSLALGDWNAEPLTDPLNAQAAGARGIVLYPVSTGTGTSEEEDEPQDPLPAPTRWTSNRCTDWGICCNNTQASVKVLPDKWSDHKLLEWQVTGLAPAGKRGYKLRQTSDLRKPENVSQTGAYPQRLRHDRLGAALSCR